MRLVNQITVTRPEEGELRQQRWSFTLFDFPAIYLENYVFEERETKRHKFRPVQVYNRLGGNRVYSGIIKEEPDVPKDVLEEAVAKVQEMIEFRVWKKRRG